MVNKIVRNLAPSAGDCLADGRAFNRTSQLMKHFWFYFVVGNALLITLVVMLVIALARRGRMQPPGAAPTEGELRHWEVRAPGWKIRCKTCGLTEPYGKYGIRKWAAGKQFTFGYCASCRRIRLHVTERDKRA